MEFGGKRVKYLDHEKRAYKHEIWSYRGLQSKRPQVKTSPSQNVPKLVKTSPKIGQNVPMVKNVGQNVPKMNFYSIFYEILGIIWDVWMKIF